MPATLMRFPAGLLLLMLSAAACDPVAGARKTVTGCDLTERFNLIHNGLPQSETAGSFVRHYDVIRNGVRRDAMVLVAPAEIRTSLAGIRGRVALEGLAAPVFNIGDGMQMDVLIADSQGRRKVFGCLFDPGRKAHDRAWIPLEIPMVLDGTPDSWLDIRLSAGARGDLVADWLALSAMRIVKKESGR